MTTLAGLLILAQEITQLLLHFQSRLTSSTQNWEECKRCTAIAINSYVKDAST